MQWTFWYTQKTTNSNNFDNYQNQKESTDTQREPDTRIKLNVNAIKILPFH